MGRTVKIGEHEVELVLDLEALERAEAYGVTIEDVLRGKVETPIASVVTLVWAGCVHHPELGRLPRERIRSMLDPVKLFRGVYMEAVADALLDTIGRPDPKDPQPAPGAAAEPRRRSGSASSGRRRSRSTG